ncbi:IclR family transcriptional regulator [Paraglaciecola aquimarina]|uniref:IclR family transcriptional regulator n=1 Tax=Paraglaciecola aquimarina TaxID=1235557 RepID=A0ABU3SXZ1_9ALTE|nr:IclR family transcriptional regulator [Paraglaciecola aquimarina]MDU0354884.1 IclR family transcriptional regulator [Paraglaciecola aquimarina]
MTETTKNKYAVPALDKALDVLEYLVSQEIAKSQTEIAQALGRGPNEIYRVLVNLEGRGYLVRDQLSGHYRASLKMYNLSRRISPIDQLRQCAMPHMEDLAVKIGHSCHLTMLYQSQTMVIVQARSQVPVSVNVTEGALFPTISTTSGKVLLANSNPEVRAMVLERSERYQQFSDEKKRLIDEELRQTREKGTLIAKSFFIEGVSDYAALVGEPDGKVIACLVVSTLNTYKSENEDKADIIDLVKATAEKITVQLGC